MDEYLSKKIKVVSFISIIMVAYIHAYNLKDRFLLPTTRISDSMSFTSFFQYFISNGLTRMAVPLFFAISGFLFFYNFVPSINNFLTKYKKRFKSLFIPYILWCVLGLLFMFVVQIFYPSSSTLTNGLIKNYKIPQYISSILLSTVSFQLWFLRDLFIYALLSPIIYFIVSKLSKWSLIPFIILWALNINLLFINNEGILFFVLGALIAIKGLKLKINKKSTINTVIFLWLIILILKTFLAYHGNPLLLYSMHRISVILGFISFWFGYDFYLKKLNANIKLSYLVGYTFFIYAFHIPFLTVLMNTSLSAFGSSIVAELLIYIVTPIISITVAIIIANLLKKYLKPVYCVLTGGRGI